MYYRSEFIEFFIKQIKEQEKSVPNGINELAKEIHRTAKDKGWWDTINDSIIPEKLLMVVSEISEAVEDYRESTNDQKNLKSLYFAGDGGDIHIEQNKGKDVETDGLLKPVGFAVEIADACIRLFDLAAYLDIDLETAIKEKMEYNKSRKYRHGNKRA